jgi:hypothetical protein
VDLENKPDKKGTNSKRNGIVFTAIGFELVGIMLTCLYLGQEIDKKYGLNGIGIAGLSMLGLAGWLTHLVILLNRFK